MSDVDRLATKKSMHLQEKEMEDITLSKLWDEMDRAEQEKIYQESLPIREQTLKGISSSALGDLSEGVGGIKDILSSREKFKEGQEFFRQQDPAYGQPMEPFTTNPFTGEPLGDDDSLTSSPRVRGKLSLMESGLGYKGSDEERIDKSALSVFPEAYQDRPEPESKSWMQRLLGRQMGGMMPGGVSNPLPYNLGGSVAQQPMAYQLGGLLKYRRSPFG